MKACLLFSSDNFDLNVFKTFKSKSKLITHQVYKYQRRGNFLPHMP